jgi:fructose-1,6-bisphosphatase/inositol monophosphatase family enzyme
LRLAIKAAHEAGRLVREASARSPDVSVKSSPVHFVTEMDYASEKAILRYVLKAVGDIRWPGSAAVALCWIACGRSDAFYEAVLQPWDFAAGLLIAREGGVDIQCTEYDHERDIIIASAPTVTPSLSQVLRNASCPHPEDASAKARTRRSHAS